MVSIEISIYTYYIYTVYCIYFYLKCFLSKQTLHLLSRWIFHRFHTRLFHSAFVPSAEDGHPSKLLRSFHLALGGVVHLCLDTEITEKSEAG